jgi:hypothetical protein
MSAVAPAEHTASIPDLHLVAASPAELAEREMYRWMLWLGLPFLVTAVVVGALFATAQLWLMGFAIVGVIGVITVMMWLAISSDTNAAPAPSH